EKRLRVDNQPYAPTFRNAIILPFDSATCFAYAHSTIGSMEDLDDAKLENVQAFFRTYYAPNNATLVVVGDFRPVELRRLVNQYFADIPSQPAPPLVSCDYKLAPGTMRRDVQDEHANLAAAFREYRLPPHTDPDLPAVELLNVILGQWESSRLNVGGVRREKGGLQAGRCGVPGRAGRGRCSTTGCSTGPSPKSTRTSIATSPCLPPTFGASRRSTSTRRMPSSSACGREWRRRIRGRRSERYGTMERWKGGTGDHAGRLPFHRSVIPPVRPGLPHHAPSPHPALARALPALQGGHARERVAARGRRASRAAGRDRKSTR